MKFLSFAEFYFKIVLALAVNAVGAVHHGNANVICIAVAITLALGRFQALMVLLKQEYASKRITIDTVSELKKKKNVLIK